MSYGNSYLDGYGSLAEQASADERASFIVNTYLHLAGAIGAFIAIEYALLTAVPAERVRRRPRSSR